MRARLALAIVALALSGCVTEFYGKPTIDGGRAKCEQICAGWNMELAGMVQMGDYSNGCVCQVPGKVVAPAAAAAVGEATVAAHQAQVMRTRNNSSASTHARP